MRRSFWFVLIGLALAFLYTPILVMALLAFNRSPIYALPFEFDLIWFVELAGDERLLRATFNSVILALATAAVSVALGVPAALALARYRFRGRALLQTLLIPPMTIPWIVLSVALLTMFFWLGVQRNLLTLFVGHVAVTLPYAVLVIGARLSGLDPQLEEAAYSLGAQPLYAFRRVTLPLIGPGVLAAGLFSVAISFDNFILSYVLAPPGTPILPVEIYTAIRQGFTPAINAISTIVFVLSALLVLLAARSGDLLRGAQAYES